MRRIVLRQTLPGSENQLRAFLDACSVKRTKAWIDARNRIVAPQNMLAISAADHIRLADTTMKLAKMVSRAPFRPSGEPDTVTLWADGKPSALIQIKHPADQWFAGTSPLRRPARPAARV